MILIGTFLTGLGWNWDKIKGKDHGTDAPKTAQTITSGDHSPAINIEQNNIILPSEIDPSSPSMPERKIIDKPIKDFDSGKDYSSGYTLAADMENQRGQVYI